jgi:FMN-dependent NADH-azoreductase
MKTILLLNASPMGTASRAYTLAKKAASNLLGAYSDTALVERDLSRLHASPIRAAYADAIIGQAEHDAPDFAASEMLIREVEICDYLIVATPMHNFSVPASLKLWIDYVLRGGRSFTYRDGYKVGLLADRPTLIVVGSGGVYHGPQARQPDYLSAYLTHVLATIGLEDVRFIRLQGLGRPDVAEQALAQADRQLAADPVFGLTSALMGS